MPPFSKTGRIGARFRVGAAAVVLLLSTTVAVEVAGSRGGGADTLVSPDGYTTLTTMGTVSAGPYTSGQQVMITGNANSTLSNANLVANSVPGQVTGNPTGDFYFEECTDPGGTTANLPTAPDNCEAATDDFTSVAKTSDGSFDNPSYTLEDLPDPLLGSATLTTGTCDVTPNTCVIGIFATNPNTTGFSYPHLFSAPFNIEVGDGLDQGDDPGNGSAPQVATTSATNSTVTASLATVAADGSNTSQVTVSLKDTKGNPVISPKSVTLSQGSGHSTIEVNGVAGSTETTNADGQAVFSVSDTTTESVTYTATDTTDSNLAVSQTALVDFSQPVATSENSSISAGSSTVANGASTTITVTLKDQGASPQPIAGKVITLSQGSGSSTIVPASTGSDTTNAQGQATFTVSDSKGETVTYAPTDSTDNTPQHTECQRHLREPDRLGLGFHRGDHDTDRGANDQRCVRDLGDSRCHVARRHQSCLRKNRSVGRLPEFNRGDLRPANDRFQRRGELHGK
jgi:hypothetical protein